MTSPIPRKDSEDVYGTPPQPAPGKKPADPLTKMAVKKITPYEESEKRKFSGKSGVEGEEAVRTQSAAENAGLIEPTEEEIQSLLEEFWQTMTETESRDEYGLTKTEISAIEEWYEKNRASLEENGRTMYFKHTGTTLSRTLVYIPEPSPRKGLHVLLKTKGGVKEVGIGAFNLATKTYHVDSKSSKVARGGAKADVPANEIQINKEIQKSKTLQQYCVAGDPFEHTGPMRVRASDQTEARLRGQKKGPRERILEGRKENVPKTVYPKLKDIPKVSLIMDHMKGGELFYKLRDPNLTDKERLQYSIQIARGYRAIHQKKIVHRDGKPENIFLDGDIPKLADWGNACHHGDHVEYIHGSSGFVAPERYYEERADIRHDIWTLGCILAETFGVPFADEMADKEKAYAELFEVDPEQAEIELQLLKKDLFGEAFIESGHPYYLISQCLTLDKSKRPTDNDIVQFLKKIPENFRELYNKKVA